MDVVACERGEACGNMRGEGGATLPRRVFARVPTGEKMARWAAEGRLSGLAHMGTPEANWSAGYMQALFDQGHLTPEAWAERMEALGRGEDGEAAR